MQANSHSSRVVGSLTLIRLTKARTRPVTSENHGISRPQVPEPALRAAAAGEGVPSTPGDHNQAEDAEVRGYAKISACLGLPSYSNARTSRADRRQRKADISVDLRSFSRPAAFWYNSLIVAPRPHSCSRPETIRVSVVGCSRTVSRIQMIQIPKDFSLVWTPTTVTIQPGFHRTGHLHQKLPHLFSRRGTTL